MKEQSLKDLVLSKDLIIFDLNGTLIRRTNGVLALVDGALDLLEFLKISDIRIGLATISYRSHAYKLLSDFNLKDYFDYILTVEDVENPKPSPDIYNKMVDHFQFNRDQILVFEDTKRGVGAAKSAQLLTISVGSNINEADRSIIDYMSMF